MQNKDITFRNNLKQKTKQKTTIRRITITTKTIIYYIYNRNKTKASVKKKKTVTTKQKGYTGARQRTSIGVVVCRRCDVDVFTTL